jgi:hypothetical protein
LDGRPRQPPIQVIRSRPPHSGLNDEDPQQWPQWTVLDCWPTATMTMIKTERHGNALASTYGHGPPPKRRSTIGAPRSHIVEDHGISWETIKAVPTFLLVTALIVLRARRDSNP